MADQQGPRLAGGDEGDASNGGINPQQGGGAAAPPGVQVMLDERDMKSVYANAYRIHTAAEEVIVDLGFNMPNPNPAAPGQQQMLFRVTDRVIMSYANAKRLSASLVQLVKRYEQQFGDIPTQQKR